MGRTASGYSSSGMTSMVSAMESQSSSGLPGKLLGFIKDLMGKGWVERQTRQMLADFKALAEAKVPAHA